MSRGLLAGYSLRETADASAAHAYLTQSYWAKGIDLNTVAKSIANSFVVSVWHEDRQIAMARIVSDYSTFAYLNDVYVLEAHRGLGISKAMLAYLHAHPSFAGIRRWALFTKDAQELYARFGWRQYPYPERIMVIDEKLFSA